MCGFLLLDEAQLSDNPPDNSLVAGKLSDRTEWDKLEIEYKKFEKALAEIEQGVAIDSMNLQNFDQSDSGCNSSSFDSLSEYNQTSTICCNDPLSSMVANYHEQLIFMDDEKAIEEVSLICCDRRIVVEVCDKISKHDRMLFSKELRMLMGNYWRAFVKAWDFILEEKRNVLSVKSQEP